MIGPLTVRKGAEAAAVGLAANTGIGLKGGAGSFRQRHLETVSTGDVLADRNSASFASQAIGNARRGSGV
jgi:hypothetical protein